MLRQIVIPDTSVMNHLVDDPEVDAIKAGIKVSFDVFIPEIVLGELVATKGNEERKRLTDLALELTSNGQLIHSSAVLTKRMEEAFDADPNGFQWREVPINFDEARRHLANGIGDQISTKQREAAKTLSDQWVEPFPRLRAHMDAVFDEKGYDRPPLEDMMPGFMREGGSLWIWAKMLYQRNDGSEPDGATVRRFVEGCPPFWLMLIALVINQYERSFRDNRIGKSLRAGRNDTLMAFYLPYCHVFLTDDGRHKNLLVEAIKYAQLPNCQVMSLEEFKSVVMPSIN